MCGIAGMFEYRSGEVPEMEVVRSMARHMAHRGPDGEGFWSSGPCALAHRRLSIIDLEGGRQPLTNEDGKVAVTFNGEIYNYKPLASQLAASGHTFRTRSDTETIVHAYEERGDAVVTALQGMFAFAIWDDRRKRLLIARDRVGIKPLYYYDDGRRLIFASEIGAILAVPGVKREEDLEAAKLFFAFGFVPAPRTGLKNIRKLPPGHILTCDLGGRPAVRRYWRRPLEPRVWDAASAAQELDRQLDQKVESHLQSDVPVGLLLSGGIDSSTILGYTARKMSSRVKTFSVFFGEDSYYDETPFARLAAKKFGSEHFELLLTPERFVQELPSFIRHMEEPVIEAAAVPLLALSRLVREHVTVVLSGEGADEDFGGYEIYRYMLGLEKLRRIPAALRGLGASALSGLGLGKLARWAKMASLPLEQRYRGVSLPDLDAVGRLLLPGVRHEAEQAALATIHPIYQYTRGAHPLERMLTLDTELWLPDDILVKADKMTMAASLELRVPFLDHEMIEFAAGLNPRLKVGLKEGKLVQRNAVRSFVPKEILERPKRGFPTPVAAMLRGRLGDVAERVLVKDRPSGHALWSRDKVASALAEHRAGRADWHKPIWMMLVYELWWRTFVANQSADEWIGEPRRRVAAKAA